MNWEKAVVAAPQCPPWQTEGVNEASIVEPALSVSEWWQGSDGRWYPPYDGKTYGVPQWHAPVVREPGLPVGNNRNPWAVVGLSLITLGIYRIYWEYRSFKDLRSFTGEGIGGGWGLALAIVFPMANMFVLPSEIGRVQRGENAWDSLSGETGFWVLLPFVGWIVWTVTVQDALNQIWASYASVQQVPSF